MFYIEFENGYRIENLSELEMYKTLWCGYFDNHGNELAVKSYGELAEV